MSLSTVRLAAEVEGSDDFHLARILLLLRAASGSTNKSVQGITKLAKLDFLLRYPTALVRVLQKLGKLKAAAAIPDQERNTIEGRMIRFRYGPWDPRYRRWIALLVARRLASTYYEGTTVHVKLTDAGVALADQIGLQEEFRELSNRSKIVTSAVGSFGAKKLMNFVYDTIPEIVGKRWGEHIDL